MGTVCSTAQTLAIDESALRDLVSRWLASNQPILSGAPLQLDKALAEAMTLCQRWPSGSGAGQLTLNPSGETVPVDQRGVSMEWLLAAWDSCKDLAVATRVFAEIFVPSKTEASKSALWYHVPTRYRGKPNVFVSHSWDCWLRHVLLLTDEVNSQLRERLACKTNSEIFVWIE